jgi:O-antigen ligase
VQIFLEQGIVGGCLFISLMILLGYYLYDIVKKRKDLFSIALFASFCALNFMALFTHSFEEAATSYTLFLIVGAYIGNNKEFKKEEKK